MSLLYHEGAGLETPLLLESEQAKAMAAVSPVMESAVSPVMESAMEAQRSVILAEVPATETSRLAQPKKKSQPVVPPLAEADQPLAVQEVPEKT